MLPQHERIAASASGIGAEKPVSRRRFIGTSAALAAAAVALPAAATEGDDAELFLLEAEFHAATVRWNETFDRVAATEEAYFERAAKWPENTPMPEDIAAEFRNLTFDQVATIQKVAPDHPCVVWLRKNDAAMDEARAAYHEQRARLRTELGLDELEAEQSSGFKAIDAVFDAIMETPAMTFAGIMVKLRRQEWAQDGDEERTAMLIDSVAGDIERMMGATMPSNVVSLAAERKARAEANKPQVLMVETVLSPNSTIAVGDLIAIKTKGGPNVMFCRWLGSTGRDIRGRFAKRGSPFELFQLDNGLRYYTQQVQLRVVQILGVVSGAHLAGKPRPHTAA